MYGSLLPCAPPSRNKVFFYTYSRLFFEALYSVGQKKHHKYCFLMKKFQIQMGIAQYKNAATPLATIGINTTQQPFSNEVCNFILAQETQKLLIIKFYKSSFYNKTDFTFLL